MSALPVADAAAVRREVRALATRRHRGALARMVALHVLAVVAGLATPRLLGRLVQDVQHGTTTGTVDRVALLVGGFVVAQAVLTRAARFAGYRLGEQVLADLREGFVERVLELPLGTVERAGTGDLLTRTTGDIDTLARTVRFAVAETLVATVTATLTVAAMFAAGPLVALPVLAALVPITVATRWYLRRAPEGYLSERAAYSVLNAGIAETAEGARTVEALRLQEQRVRRTDDDLRHAYDRERYTLFLRTVWFPSVETAYLLPVVGCLLLGGLLYLHGHATLGQVTTVVLYAQQLIDPVDRLLGWLDELQVGSTSLARLLGVGTVPDDRAPTGALPDGERIEVRDVRFSYLDGGTCCTASTCRSRRASG